jgi:hypothetical protein
MFSSTQIKHDDKKKPSLVALYWERGIRLKPRRSFCPQSRGLVLAYTYENYEELNFEVIASKWRTALLIRNIPLAVT